MLLILWLKYQPWRIVSTGEFFCEVLSLAWIFQSASKFSKFDFFLCNPMLEWGLGKISSCKKIFWFNILLLVSTHHTPSARYKTAFYMQFYINDSMLKKNFGHLSIWDYASKEVVSAGRHYFKVKPKPTKKSKKLYNGNQWLVSSYLTLILNFLRR